MTRAQDRQARPNPVDLLPGSVRVGAFDFRIQRWSMHESAAAQRFGEFSAGEQTIRVQHEFASGQKAVDTLMHEIAHAIFWVYGIQDEDKEERTVGAFSTGLTALYRDNPWLLTWIGNALGA